nr:FAD-dependent oxidoreductase [uncultured Victivallis sp.]
MRIMRPAAEVPVRNRTEVLVVGGGPAGFGAAVAAARAGAKVTLIEQGGMLGGMWTLGLLSPFFDNLHQDGLNRELREGSCSATPGAACGTCRSIPAKWPCCSTNM